MNSDSHSRCFWQSGSLPGHRIARWSFRLSGFIALVLLCVALIRVAHGQEAPFAVGEDVRVATGGPRLNLRLEPGLRSPIVVPLENGTVLQVVDGPEAADSYTWWKLSGEAGEGWAAAAFLEPIALNDASGDAQTTTIALPSTDSTDPRPIASSYGFSGTCFLGWRRPSLDNLLPLNLDTVRTYDNVEEAATILNRSGFTSTAHENSPANEAIGRLPQDEVFFFYGHGDSRFLVFHDGDCNYALLPAQDVQQVEAPELRLSVLLGCNTGANLSAPDNVMRAFQAAGSDKVIGFNTEVWEIGANHWNTLFWQYAVNDGLEAGDAAQKAINDTIYGLPWLAPGSLVILREEDVYLGTDPVPAEETRADLLARLRAWLEEERASLTELPTLMRMWLEEQWTDLEARVEESVQRWLQQEAEQLLAGLLQEMEGLLSEICLAPVVPALLRGGVSFREYRRRQGRVSAKE